MPAILPSQAQEMSFQSRSNPDHILRWEPYYHEASISSIPAPTDNHLTSSCRQWAPTAPQSKSQPYRSSHGKPPRPLHSPSEFHTPLCDDQLGTMVPPPASSNTTARVTPTTTHQNHPPKFPSNHSRCQKPQRPKSPVVGEPTQHKTASSSMLMVHGFPHHQAHQQQSHTATHVHHNNQQHHPNNNYNYGHLHPTYHPPQYNNNPQHPQHRTTQNPHIRNPQSIKRSHGVATVQSSQSSSGLNYNVNSVDSYSPSCYDSSITMSSSSFAGPPSSLSTQASSFIPSQLPSTSAAPSYHNQLKRPKYNPGSGGSAAPRSLSSAASPTSSQLSPRIASWPLQEKQQATLATKQHERLCVLSMSSMSDNDHDYMDGDIIATCTPNADCMEDVNNAASTPMAGKRKRTRRGRRGGKNRRRYQNRLGNEGVKSGDDDEDEEFDLSAFHTPNSPMLGVAHEGLPDFDIDHQDLNRMMMVDTKAGFTEDELFSQLVQLMSGIDTNSDGSNRNHPNHIDPSIPRWPSPELAIDPPRIISASFNRNNLQRAATMAPASSSTLKDSAIDHTSRSTEPYLLSSTSATLPQHFSPALTLPSDGLSSTNDLFTIQPQFNNNHQFPHSLDFAMDPLDPIDPLLLGLTGDAPLLEPAPQQQLLSQGELRQTNDRSLVNHHSQQYDTASLSNDDERKVIEALAAIATAQQNTADKGGGMDGDDVYPNFSSFASEAATCSSLGSSNIPFSPPLAGSHSEPHQLNNLTRTQHRFGRNTSLLDLLGALKF